MYPQNVYPSQQPQQVSNAVPQQTPNNPKMVTSNGGRNGDVISTENKQNENGKTGINKEENVIKKNNKKHHLLYNDEMISMEEQRFLHSDYHWTPKKEEKGNCNQIENMKEDIDEDEDIDLKHNNGNGSMSNQIN